MELIWRFDWVDLEVGDLGSCTLGFWVCAVIA